MKLNRTLIASMIYITWIIIFAVYNYHQQKTELISVLDKRLEIAARNFTNIIPKNFHHKGMSKNSITKAKDLELVKLFNKYAKTNNIYYIYSMIIQNNKIFFAASNATKEGLEKNNGGYYFYHYDDAGPHIYEAFKNKEPTFHYVNDQWGSFRSAFVPYVEKDGTVYVVGADIRIEYISTLLHHELIKTLVISLIFILAAIPFLRAFTSQTHRWASELKIQKETAEKANKAKSEFLSSMSHELKTPMNTIMGFGQIMEADENLNNIQKRSVKTILSAGNHLLELVNDVLDLATINKGNLKYSLADCNLNNILNECLLLVEPLAIKHNIQIFNNISSTSNHTIYVDYMRFKQVMLNLLSNAIKYNNPNGKVTLNSEVLDNKHICINVIDTGQGLTKEEQQSLFKPFVRIGDYKGIDGAGIGLALSKNLIELMGGKIGVESKTGTGSRFFIQVPLS